MISVICGEYSFILTLCSFIYLTQSICIWFLQSSEWIYFKESQFGEQERPTGAAGDCLFRCDYKSVFFSFGLFLNDGILLFFNDCHA